MKNYSKLLMLLVAFAAMITLSSCNNDDVVSSDNYPVYNNSGIVADVFNSTPLEVISPDAISVYDDIQALEEKPTPNNKKIDLGPLGYALSRLNLTPEQIEQIKKAAAEYKDCITKATEKVRAAEKLIMDALKANVQEVLAKVKDGTYTKAQGREEIRILQKTAAEALKAIEGRAEAMQAVKDCYKIYLDKVKVILTDAQEAMLDKILKGGKNTDPGKNVKIDGPLGPVLVGLGLTPDQVKAANDCAKIYNDCYTAAMKPIMAAEQQIMNDLKLRQQQIMADLKAGKITKEEANQAMQQAEANAKQLLANIPGKAEAQAAAKKCYEAYLDCIKNIKGLTKDQLDKIGKATGTNTGTGKDPVVKIEGPLGKVLVELGLNDKQVSYANNCAKAYTDCVNKATAAIAEQEKIIMDSYNKKQEAIMIDLKNGKITQEEANKLMTANKIEVSKLLENIPGRAEAQANAKKCYDAYLACIKSIPELTPEQLAKLNAAIGTVKP